MAVKLRLRRMGRKKLPIHAVVAADVRSPRDGRFIEDVGRYYPLEEPARVVLKDDRVLYWLNVGAQPTPTVRSLLSKEGILLRLHMQRKGKSEHEIEDAVAAHRARHQAKSAANAKVTSADRRQEALRVETAAAEAREAALAEARQKAIAEKKAQAAAAAEAAAAAKAEVEAEAKAEVEAEAEAEVEAEASASAEAQAAEPS